MRGNALWRRITWARVILGAARAGAGRWRAVPRLYWRADFRVPPEPRGE